VCYRILRRPGGTRRFDDPGPVGGKSKTFVTTTRSSAPASGSAFGPEGWVDRGSGGRRRFAARPRVDRDREKVEWRWSDRRGARVGRVILYGLSIPCGNFPSNTYWPNIYWPRVGATLLPLGRRVCARPLAHRAESRPRRQLVEQTKHKPLHGSARYTLAAVPSVRRGREGARHDDQVVGATAPSTREKHLFCPYPSMNYTD
jgi:hypothetical protein